MVQCFFKKTWSSSFIFLYFNVLYLIKMMDLDLNFRWPKSWQELDMLHLCTKADFCDSMWGQTWRSGLGNAARSKAWQPLESQLCCSEMEVLRSSRSNLSQTPWDPTKSGFCLGTEVVEHPSYCAKVATKARKQFQGQVLQEHSVVHSPPLGLWQRMAMNFTLPFVVFAIKNFLLGADKYWRRQPNPKLNPGFQCVHFDFHSLHVLSWCRSQATPSWSFMLSWCY